MFREKQEKGFMVFKPNILCVTRGLRRQTYCIYFKPQQFFDKCKVLWGEMGIIKD
jgi:hypothetical protein